MIGARGIIVKRDADGGYGVVSMDAMVIDVAPYSARVQWNTPPDTSETAWFAIDPSSRMKMHGQSADVALFFEMVPVETAP